MAHMWYSRSEGASEILEKFQFLVCAVSLVYDFAGSRGVRRHRGPRGKSKNGS